MFLVLGGSIAPQQFVKIGNTMVRYMDERVTHEEAKHQCEALESALVEFWNNAAWSEVISRKKY